MANLDAGNGDWLRWSDDAPLTSETGDDRERATLKTLNGVLTSSDADARVYARCYWASVNASDLIVRIGGGAYMPLRQPLIDKPVTALIQSQPHLGAN